MSMAALLAIGQHEKLVRTFVSSLDPDDMYCCDRYWLLLHELNLQGLLPSDGRFDEYVETSGRAVLQDHSVSFFTTTEWEDDGEDEI